MRDDLLDKSTALASAVQRFVLEASKPVDKNYGPFYLKMEDALNAFWRELNESPSSYPSIDAQVVDLLIELSEPRTTMFGFSGDSSVCRKARELRKKIPR